MARRKKQEQPDRFGEFDTGIYRRRRFALKRSDRLLTTEEKATARNALMAAFSERPDSFTDRMARLKDWLRDTVKHGDHWQATDARKALACLSQVEAILAVRITRTRAEQLVDLAMDIGELVTQIHVEPFEEYARTQINRINNRPPVPWAKLRPKDWQDHVLPYIRRRVLKGENAKPVCEDAARQLNTAVFPGLEGKRIDISAKRLQNRWTDRTK